MRITKAALAVLGILALSCFGIVESAQAAAPDLVGTWRGRGEIAGAEGYVPFTVVAKVTSQKDKLFLGTFTLVCTVCSPEKLFWKLSGHILGAKVNLTTYEGAEGQSDAIFFAEATYSAANNTIRGVLHSVGGQTGYLNLTKQ